MTDEDILNQDNQDRLRTPEQSAKLMDRLGDLGGKALQGARGIGGAVGSGLSSGARAVASEVTNFREKRAVTAGLKEDYSVKGKTKRYWLDKTHYIVFDPNSTSERDMAQQAIDDFRLYGKFEGEAGDRNEVIEAGETELGSRKLTRDPVIEPETSRRMAAAGNFLAHGNLMGPQKRAAGHYKNIDLDEDETLGGGEDEMAEIPKGKNGFRTPEDNKVGKFSIPEIKIFSDKEMFPEMVKKRGARRQDEEEEEPRARSKAQPYRPGQYSVPNMDQIFPKIFQDAPPRGNKKSGPVEYVIPNSESFMPKIKSESAPRGRPKGPIEVRQPKVADILPKIHVGLPGGGRGSGPIVYRPPSISEILPQIQTGFGGRTRQPQPFGEVVETKPVRVKKPRAKKASKAKRAAPKAKKTTVKKKGGKKK